MAQEQKATKEVDNVLPYLEGVAKSLVDRLYGPAGPAWGTTLLEDTVAAVRKSLTEKMLHQALARQAAQVERPPKYAVCPGCGQPPTALGPPEPRRLETGAGDAVWEEPKNRCQKCRRDFFPSEQELGD
jgi:hypothetical protein